MRLCLSFLAVLMFSFSGFCQDCTNSLIAASEKEYKGNNATKKGEGFFVKAYKEIHKKNPNMNDVCNDLDLSGQNFQVAKQYFDDGFETYKNAVEVCEGDQHDSAIIGINNCDEGAENAQESLDGVNQAFAENCSK